MLNVVNSVNLALYCTQHTTASYCVGPLVSRTGNLALYCTQLTTELLHLCDTSH